MDLVLLSQHKRSGKGMIYIEDAETHHHLQGVRISPLEHSELTYLVDDVDAVINPLPSEDRVEVVEPVLQVVFPVTKWDDDGHLNSGESFSWPVVFSTQN